MINLVKNALKFTYNGAVTLKAFFDPFNELLKVAVIDTGRGIAESEKVRLFKAFGKLPRTGDVNEEGLGLGLSICFKIL